MIPGHTKFICNSFFGNIKKIYRAQRVNNLDDVEWIINHSSKSNEGLKYNNRNGWTWYNFQDFLSKHFVNCPYITSYYHFQFNKNYLGKVFCSKESGGTETSFILLRDNSFNINGQIDILDIAPLSNERKLYLYKNIRKYVDFPFRDEYCADPKLSS